MSITRFKPRIFGVGSHHSILFLKMGQTRPLFVYFRSFLITISVQIEKSIDGVLGIRTQGRRMVGADKTTELWRPPDFSIFTATDCDSRWL